MESPAMSYWDGDRGVKRDNISKDGSVIGDGLSRPTAFATIQAENEISNFKDIEKGVDTPTALQNYCPLMRRTQIRSA